MELNGVGYNFNKKVIPYKVELVNFTYNGYRCGDFYIQGSLTSSTAGFYNLTPQLTLPANSNRYTFYVSNLTETQYVKLYITSHYKDISAYSSGISEFQVYYINVPDGL